jgi:biotin carboxyl carrier protein
LQFEVETGGRIRRVNVSRTGDTLAVSVDGRLHTVDAARVDASTLSLIVDSAVSPDSDEAAAGSGRRRVYDASVTSDPAAGRLTITVRATPVTVALNGRRRPGAERRGGQSGPVRVVAPMPGKIVRVLVRPGDTVGPRQPVVVVEAMKMENELRADRGGTVSEVHAQEGSSVDAGALLIVIQ